MPPIFQNDFFSIDAVDENSDDGDSDDGNNGDFEEFVGEPFIKVTQIPPSDPGKKSTLRSTLNKKKRTKCNRTELKINKSRY